MLEMSRPSASAPKPTSPWTCRARATTARPGPGSGCWTCSSVRARLRQSADAVGCSTGRGGRRRRITSWADGTYRAVTFSDAAGLAGGLMRNCSMTMIKQGDRLLFDFTGTSRDALQLRRAPAGRSRAHHPYIYTSTSSTSLPVSSATLPADRLHVPAELDAPRRAGRDVLLGDGRDRGDERGRQAGRAGPGSAGWWRQVAASEQIGDAIVLAGMSRSAPRCSPT